MWKPAPLDQVRIGIVFQLVGVERVDLRLGHRERGAGREARDHLHVVGMPVVGFAIIGIGCQRGIKLRLCWKDNGSRAAARR